MTSLREALASRASDEPLWRGRSGWRTAGDARREADVLAGQIAARRVALAFADDEALAVALLAAEGHCESALLVPAGWDQAMLETYLPRAGVELLITDRAELSGASTLRPTVSAPRSEVAFARHAYETKWIVPTSGTTGEPKLVEHTLASLARTVKAEAAKGRGLTWGLVYELARFAGLQVFLQALLGHSRLAFVDRTSGTEGMVASLAAAGCNALSATPTLWRRMMMTVSAADLPLRVVTLGGEIADQPILSLLAARYRDARVVHIYASTEAGVGFSVTDGRAGFPVSFLETSPQGAQVKVDAQGMLWLKPATSAQRFVGETHVLVDAEGWINSGDHVVREGERYFFLGRANGAINVGGNKVFPEEVENCIRSVEGVALVGVRARANPLVGAVVEALVKPAPAVDRVRLKQSIAATCRATLAPYKVPALVTWVDELTVSAAGKLVRS